MHSVKKDGRAESIERPETEREPFPFPPCAGVEIDLEPKERSPEREAGLKDEGQPSAGDELAQPVEREHQDRDAGEVDGVDGVLSLLALAAVDAELQPRVVLFRIEMEVILLRIVVGDVDVAVPEKAVGREEVIRLVAGKRCAPGDQDECGCLVNKERRQKEADDPPARRERREPENSSVKERSSLNQEAGESGELEEERRSDGQDGQEAKPDPEIAARHIKSQEPGAEKEEAEREQGQSSPAGPECWG